MEEKERVNKGKTVENLENKDSKKRKIKRILIIISVFIVLIIFISIIFALMNINNSNIISGISIEGIDVSGLSKEEAKGKLETIYNEKMQKNILVKYQDYESEINPTTIETNYKIDDAVEKAFLVGRSDNILINNYNILFTLIGKKNINVNIEINEEITKKSIDDIGSKLPGAIVESSYYKEGEDTLIITKGKEGIKIDTDQLLNKIKSVLSNIEDISNYIEIPVINKIPDAIDIDKIHQEIYKEAKDAYYTKDPFTIYPEVYGVDFNVEEAKELLKEDKEEYTIKLVITKPSVTVEQFGSEAFPDRLSIFTTRYDASNVDRTTNLRIACQKINSKVILPGETFSYNATLGERTIANGYKEAKIYFNGEVVDGLGGGICQISSTLYNAAVMSNLEIVERRNHQFVTSYLPAGRDATVVYGLTDFKFKNTRKYPIKINASVQNGIATVSIYGIKQDQEYTISFETRTITTIPFTVKYVEDSSIAEGTEKIKQKGANGLQTETYKIMSLNGSVVSKTLLSKDTYTPMQKIIIKGTKNTSETNATINNKDNNEQNKEDKKAENTNDNNTQENENIINTTNTTPSNIENDKVNQNSTNTTDKTESKE